MNKKIETPLTQESIKAENDFFKLKMMLENGAQFNSFGQADLSPEMENEWLKHIMAFEKESNAPGKIKVFDKIKRPGHFKPIADIHDDDLIIEMDRLLEWLRNYNIELHVHSPNISLRELYRFTIEELFAYEIEDINLPGCVCNFTYDDFYPDQNYENETTAVDDCIKIILSKIPVDFMSFFLAGNIQLNDCDFLNEKECRTAIKYFKDMYEEINCLQVSEVKCEIIDDSCTVSGNVIIQFISAGNEQVTNTKWLVGFEKTGDLYWNINKIQIAETDFRHNDRR